MAFLRAMNGSNLGKLYPLGDSAVLGRHPDCSIVLDVGAVSRQHARITKSDDDYLVEDLQSRNGTFRNGVRVEGPTKLAENDELKICDLVFSFHFEPPQAPAATTRTLESVEMIDDESAAASSTIMSKLDVSTGSTSLRLTVNPEVKLKALLAIARNLGRAVRLDEVLAQLLDNLFKIFIQADRGFISLMDAAADRLVTKAVKHRHEEMSGPIRMSRTIINSAIDRKEAILSADASTDSQFQMSESIVDFQIHSVMCAPLLDSDGEVLGVIQVDTNDPRRRFSRDDLDVLASVACQAAVAVENAQLHEIAVREEVLQRELGLAHRVQKGLLPAGPPQVAGYQFFDFYNPAQKLGGDYYDYVHMPGNRLASVLADVCGKGIAAALLVARLSAEIRYCLASLPEPLDAVKRLNQVFCENRWEDKFVTMLLTVLDPARHEVTFANAGHMPPLMRRASGVVEEAAEGQGGLPLGIDGDATYEQFSIQLAPGDAMIMYTDGVLDAENRQGDRYGAERLQDKVRSSAADAAVMGQQLIADVKQFIGDHPQADDICLTCLRRVV
jgi:sigma-B regulation protein RsbU (phosphoserine phosphatase)